MKGTILLTGGSGFLGSRIARILLSETECGIVAVVRGASRQEAERRMRRLWGDWPEAAGEIGGRVRVVAGDLTHPLLGLSREEYRGLVASVTHVIHSAAELDLDGPLEELRRTNVGGTARLLELALAAHLDHGLTRFSHVSTAYVAGGRTGEVREEDLSDESGFSNAYEQTKYEGERLVRGSLGGFPISVFRPGMVVGDSHTGEIQTFNTVYVPLRLYLSGKLRLIPARPQMRLNLVPVDYVARAVARLTLHPEAAGRTFHLTVDSAHLPSAKEVLDLARGWAESALGEKLPPARFVPFERIASLVEKKMVNVPSCLVSYFNENRRYMRENADRLLGPYEPDWTTILPRLLEYAAARGFLRRSGRTVHEQVLVRLQSRSLPLRVHDLGEDGLAHRRSSEEMCGEIRSARRSLELLGVRPQDRVALVGHNSSRFLSLDVAIGLVGAVSVPLYYTAPPAEIEAALRISGARLLFVGARDLLTALAGVRAEARLISFCNDATVHHDGVGELEPASKASGGILSWSSFLALSQNPSGNPQCEKERDSTAPANGGPPRQLEAPSDLDDIATIRFTSGTTGEPKGVTFRHAQLTWLAETVISVLPWRARIRPGRYLSFLPMNHVVEGILGTYAPAFMPAPVDVYFLEDIHGLPTALPKVRPTVFFSVPRFYEKLWERFADSPAGKLYRNSEKGVLHRLARPALRRSLLRRAGLNACMQLIVGSAPCSYRLLEAYRELGIEVHNAYGLTEAPLITINRLGRNRIGTVGTPLPETELRLASDGEILVRGPQVTTGSWPESPVASPTDDRNLVPGPAREWLTTGDFGSIDSEGRLAIEGRKKDILVTSYGKNIQASKIEGLLRSIPGVMEAVVLGENRPAVCGLIWLNNPSPTKHDLAELDRAVESVNDHLSHPERLKRWAVLAEKPSINNAELTGNLKLKRAVVAAHRASVVRLLYEDMSGRPDHIQEIPAAVAASDSTGSHVPGAAHEAAVGDGRRDLGVIHLGREARKCA